MLRIVGLDQSLTKAGVSSLGKTEVVKPPKNVEGIERLEFWFESTHDIAADLIVMEGYSYGSHNKAHQIGEAGGVVKLAIWQQGIPLVLIAPSKLKMFATGNGNAGKPEVVSHVTARSGQVFSSDDEADAYALRQLGLAHFDPNQCVMVPTNKKHREALAGIDWPIIS